MLAVKTWHINFLIRSDNNTFSTLDFIRSQLILNPFRTVSFNSNFDAALLTFLNQGFLSHVSVGNTVNTCSNTNNQWLVVVITCTLSLSSFLSLLSFSCLLVFFVFFSFSLFKKIDNFFRSLSILQSFN